MAEERKRNFQTTDEVNGNGEESEWKAAMTFITKGPSATLEFLPQELKTLFYAYKSQALDGPCPSGQDGSLAIDHVLRAKQHAWKSLGDMPKSQAKREFIKLLTQVVPDWKNWYSSYSETQKNKNIVANEGSALLQDFLKRTGIRASL
eukprot:TRINITY_DN343_c0_g1_i1.p1 TRINITY_DN343_c0_g1~~TRINITY_DN343_c0_g1_i1.p1  ORF type:complete len:148 (+),score=25.89 TRINITY_DN343_c0_g1_i1:106-549(+)